MENKPILVENLPDFDLIGNKLLDKVINALNDLRKSLDAKLLTEVLNLLTGCEGVVLITGAGTSSTIARRLAHILTCSGVPSYFLDAGQSIHGYSAIITSKDILIGFSRGGETDEINFLAKIAKKAHAKVIGVIENVNSSFAKLCDIVLVGAVSTENEPIDTIPLANTIVQAVLCDILTAAINNEKGFNKDNFGIYHPGGAVGKRLNTGK